MAVEMVVADSGQVILVDESRVDYWLERGLELAEKKAPARKAQKKSEK